MIDTAPLDTAVEALADRLRRLPESVLRRSAAARGQHLARQLTRCAQRLERPGRDSLEMPDVGVFSVGDQLAVAGHDLAHALREAPQLPDERDDWETREEALRQAVALVRAAGENMQHPPP